MQATQGGRGGGGIQQLKDLSGNLLLLFMYLLGCNFAAARALAHQRKPPKIVASIATRSPNEYFLGFSSGGLSGNSATSGRNYVGRFTRTSKPAEFKHISKRRKNN